MPKTSKRMQELKLRKELNQEEISMRERIVDFFDQKADVAYQAVKKAEKWTAGFACGFLINAIGFTGHQEWLEQTGQYLGMFETEISKGFGIGMLITGALAGLAIYNQTRKEAKFDRAVEKYDTAVDNLNAAVAEGDDIQDDIVRTEKFERITRYGTELYEQSRQEEMLGITAGDNAQPDASVQIAKIVKPQSVVEDAGAPFDPTN